MKLSLTAMICLVAVILMAADDDTCGTSQRSEADKKMDAATRTMTEQAVAQTGMPGITNFTEKKIVKKLYELRDQNISTFSYVPDMQGRLWHLCDSIGYGLPYGVQFTNPHTPMFPAYHDSAMADQPEPNGLFMPPSAEGTWVICVDEKQKGNFQPVYVEPRIIVSLFKLRAEGEYAQR